MMHTVEECPLHNLGLGELLDVSKQLGFQFPELMRSNKKMIVSMLHEYVENYQPLSRVVKGAN